MFLEQHHSCEWPPTLPLQKHSKEACVPCVFFFATIFMRFFAQQFRQNHTAFGVPLRNIFCCCYSGIKGNSVHDSQMLKCEWRLRSRWIQVPHYPVDKGPRSDYSQAAFKILATSREPGQWVTSLPTLGWRWVINLWGWQVQGPAHHR